MPKHHKGDEERWKLFAEEYAKTLNATEAARKAGYSAKSESSLAVQGARLLNNAKVQAHLQTLIAQRTKKNMITADVILGELLKLATADVTQAFDDNGHLKPLKELPEGLRKSIKSIDVYKDFTEGVEVGETQRLSFWDKNKSLELLGKHLKLFTDKIEAHNSHLIEMAREIASMPDVELDRQIVIEAERIKGKK